MIGLMFHTIFSAIFIIFLLKYVSVTGWYNNDIYLAPFFNESVTDQFVIFFHYLSSYWLYCVHCTTL